MWTIEVQRETLKRVVAWENLGEGPWDTREGAEEFASAEVGIPWRVVRLIDNAGNDVRTLFAIRVAGATRAERFETSAEAIEHAQEALRLPAGASWDVVTVDG